MAHALRASAYSSLHRLGGANQGGADARLHRRVACIGDDHVLLASGQLCAKASAVTIGQTMS